MDAPLRGCAASVPEGLPHHDVGTPLVHVLVAARGVTAGFVEAPGPRLSGQMELLPSPGDGDGFGLLDHEPPETAAAMTPHDRQTPEAPRTTAVVWDETADSHGLPVIVHDYVQRYVVVLIEFHDEPLLLHEDLRAYADLVIAEIV